MHRKGHPGHASHRATAKVKHFSRGLISASSQQNSTLSDNNVSVPAAGDSDCRGRRLAVRVGDGLLLEKGFACFHKRLEGGLYRFAASFGVTFPRKIACA